MKKLRIAQIAPLWYKIPPEKYGGIELIVYNLTEELVRRGHKVTLFASGDSETSAKLFSVCPRSLKRDGVEWTNLKYNLLNLSEAFSRQEQFDIMHSHMDLYDLYFTPFLKTPVVSTMHNRLMIDKIMINGRMQDKGVERLNIYRHFHNHNIVTISNAQKKLSRVKMNFVGTVYNGIDIKQFKYNSKGSDHFIWIGRASADKGMENAVLFAKKAKVKLVLAGRVESENEKIFFNQKIKPHIDGKMIKFIGEISVKQKSDFFGNAKALLYLMKWDEPFGLVMAEALACGTPVIAFDRGSASEIIEHGKTGYVVNSIGEVGKAVNNINKINRQDCRLSVEKKFNIAKMADGYEEIYSKLIFNQTGKR